MSEGSSKEGTGHTGGNIDPGVEFLCSQLRKLGVVSIKPEMLRPSLRQRVSLVRPLHDILLLNELDWRLDPINAPSIMTSLWESVKSGKGGPRSVRAYVVNGLAQLGCPFVSPLEGQEGVAGVEEELLAFGWVCSKVDIFGVIRKANFRAIQRAEEFCNVSDETSLSSVNLMESARAEKDVLRFAVKPVEEVEKLPFADQVNCVLEMKGRLESALKIFSSLERERHLLCGKFREMTLNASARDHCAVLLSENEFQETMKTLRFGREAAAAVSCCDEMEDRFWAYMEVVANIGNPSEIDEASASEEAGRFAAVYDSESDLGAATIETQQQFNGYLESHRESMEWSVKEWKASLDGLDKAQMEKTKEALTSVSASIKSELPDANAVLSEVLENVVLSWPKITGQDGYCGVDTPSAQDIPRPSPADVRLIRVESVEKELGGVLERVSAKRREYSRALQHILKTTIDPGNEYEVIASTT